MDKNSLLLKIARDAIESNFNPEVKIDKEFLLSNFSFLNEKQATFVTLTINGKLRGCIGSLIAHRILLDDLIYNAKAAAFDDPRFNSLSFSEFNEIKIEISLLTAPEILEYKDFEDLKKKLIPNKHGVILELNGKRATFLPQVWEQLPEFNAFMVHLCQKAGLNPSSLSALPKIQTYEVIKIEEE
ncbi:AmmeMemoRadiSam system protein A [Halarcobacter anaerophilus]|jgi:hypothetical protein|uniref:AMMECR1 domain-containing protein n=1 Tax=Halarcobacter anaerophilus TaxID=877500 RepID=A0A4Q0XWK6_9BACT|nr:AmmeMemoRadiSam system protein A [Halarcobacter anaerophilus]QDF28230.1 AmmeMemoRadiSam system protein A [Halarcobacter anaerophilus]RXJ61385.1 AMMECR1 domain-containing protein [Halarcobacter anaerophilus]